MTLVAQLGENCTLNAKVVGSNPVLSLKPFSGLFFPVVLLWLHSHLSSFLHSHVISYKLEISDVISKALVDFKAIDVNTFFGGF